MEQGRLSVSDTTRIRAARSVNLASSFLHLSCDISPRALHNWRQSQSLSDLSDFYTPFCPVASSMVLLHQINRNTVGERLYWLKKKKKCPCTLLCWCKPLINGLNMCLQKPNHLIDSFSERFHRMNLTTFCARRIITVLLCVWYVFDWFSVISNGGLHASLRSELLFLLSTWRQTSWRLIHSENPLSLTVFSVCVC